MIELLDVINSANSFVDKSKGMLVLHRSMKMHQKFKLYKIFEYNLYRVKGKEKELIMAHTETKSVPSDDMVKAWNEADKEFLTVLIQYFMSNLFKEICDVQLLPD